MKRKTNSIKRRLAAAAACLALFQPPAGAEDIDLFVQPAGENGGVPNVLILLDNTANWEQPFVNEIAAIVDAVTALEVTNEDGDGVEFRLGLMLFTETGNPNNNIDGGYVRAAIRDLDADYKTKFIDLLNDLHVVQDRSNGGKAGITMMEAYYYFAGQNPRSGNNKVKTDYLNNPTGSAEDQAIYDLPENALPQFAGSRAAGPPYNSPVEEGSCGQNFIIYLSNGAAQDNSSDNTAARNGLIAEAGDTTTIPISPTGSMSSMADEWSRFMEQSPYAITTYTIDVDPISTGQGPGWTALLKSMASVSRGKYFAVSATTGGGEQVALALKTIFSEIQSVNTVFASVALPVSVNTEGTYLNQVYIGMFRPDRDALPRWVGNLKQYKFGIGVGGLETQDANSNSAINSSTGFITECARSFWTPAAVDDYWAFRPQGSCLTIANSRFSNYPDGNVVEKGAQAYKLRAPTTTRSPSKACSDSACTSLMNFADVDHPALGAADAAEHDRLLAWALGMDLDAITSETDQGLDSDENINGITIASTPPERRPSFHADVVHSRPVAINMGTDAAPEIVVFYGANDGALRVVNGNRGEPVAQPIGGVAAGAEMWSFIPPEFYGHVKRLRDNTTQISFFGNTTTDPAPLPKPYGVDGPITAYRPDASTLWLFATMRRGGRSVYAFDFSTIDTDPSSPTLKWRRGCGPDLADDSACSAGFDDIGQTWSAPVVMKAAGYSSGSAPLLIMGGGYDACEDADPDTCGTTKGDRIFVLDANTGNVVTSFPTTRGVVADVFVLTDDSGLAKWAYAADMGGNIYRIGSGVDTTEEFGDTDPATEWTMTKIASLGCPTAATACTPTRKFMMPLDVVVDLDGTHVILTGSGDREKPLQGFGSAYGVSNFFFRVNDRPWDTEWLSDEQDTCSTELICMDSLLTIGETNPDPNDLLAHPKGWHLELAPHEQVVTSAITVFGTTTFSTHTPVVPEPGGCTSNLGTAKVYNISYENAASRNGTISRSEVVVGGGLPPSPVAGMVTLDDGTVMPFIIGADPNSPLEGGEPVPYGFAQQSKGVTYWYIHK
jgi:type IV pilus assembly protein PilY1